MGKIKHIALVAHDNRKKDLVEWVKWNSTVLLKHQMVSTGTTGRLIEKAMDEILAPEGLQDFRIMKLKSGPLGGDQQLGAILGKGTST
jgi:methylglyoxal synthase